MWGTKLQWLLPQKGFTLIELVVVVAIVGILSSVAGVSYSSYKKRARNFSAKKTLTSSIIVAQTFKANAGFYLPNLKEMHVSLKGLHDYSYVIGCLDESGDVHWGTDPSKACGKFTVGSNYVHDTDTNTWTAPSDSKCWMGYILYHYHHHEHPSDLPMPPFGTEFPCTSDDDLKFSDDYKIQGHNRGVILFPDKDDSNHDTVAKKFFVIRDSREMCQRGMTVKETVYTDKSCGVSQGFAVHNDKVENVIDVVVDDPGNDTKDYLSSPTRLVINALACTRRDENCGESAGGLENQEFNIITMDSLGMIKEWNGTTNL